MDADDVFRLQLWRDAQGFFGELSSPVLDADSPTSRLYDVKWDPAAGRLELLARPSGKTVRIVGGVVEAGVPALASYSLVE